MNSHSLPLSLSLYWSCLCTSNKAVCWGGESSYHRLTNQLKKPLASRFMGLSMLFLKAKVYYHCELFTWFSDKLIFKQICWGVMLHDEPPLRNQNLKVAPFLHTEFLHNYWHTHTLLINQFLWHAAARMLKTIKRWGTQWNWHPDMCKCVFHT